MNAIYSRNCLVNPNGLYFGVPEVGKSEGTSALIAALRNLRHQKRAIQTRPAIYQTASRRGVLGSWLGRGQRTLGWAAAAPIASWAAEGRLRTLQAIHAPLIAISNPPRGCVGRLAPVVRYERRFDRGLGRCTEVKMERKPLFGGPQGYAAGAFRGFSDSFRR